MLEWAERGDVAASAPPLTNGNPGESPVASKHLTRTDLTAEYVRSILDYDPETGAFRWRARVDAPARVNTRFAGKVAGSVMINGYRCISISSVRYYAHRLAWLHYYGEWPALPIDHRDGDGLNNRIANLRLATMSQNLANTGSRKSNKSGFKGVSWDKRKGKWKAEITKDGKSSFLGYFDLPAEGHAAYIAAAKRLHGEFARAE